MTGRTTLAVHISRLVDWSPQGRITLRTLAAAAVGVSGPVLLGLAVGRPGLGLSIGLGALFLSGTAETGDAPRWRAAASSFTLALAAVAAALAISASPAPEAALIGLALLAALVSGFSRPVAAATLRLIILTVLCATLLAARTSHREVVGAIFVLGAGWNILVRTVLSEPVPASGATPPARRATLKQQWTHWRRGLVTLAGWQFPLRLAGGLAVACALRDAWPEHHFGWIILTTALLTQRPLERFPVRILQRTVGTAAGVGLAWLLLSSHLDPRLAMGVIAALVALATLARMRSYLLYAILSTPVILLVMDFGRPVDPTLLQDRLIATAIGAALVLVGNPIMAALSARSQGA